MQEKRKSVRFKAPCRIQYSISGSAQEISGIIKNISMGGAKISLSSPPESLPQGIILFTIILSQTVLNISGEVLWGETHEEIRIRFVNIPDSYKEEIYKYISKYHMRELTSRWWDF